MADANKIENIYELLDIDPSIMLTATDARRRITEARDRWNKNRQSIKFGPIARVKLERLARLEATLGIENGAPAGVEQRIRGHRDEMLQRAETSRSTKRDQLKREIEFAGKNGTILDEEFASWLAFYTDVVTEAELEEWTRPYRRDDEEGAKQRRDIEDRLKAVGEESLFSLVGKSLRATNAEVRQAADALYAEANLRARTSAEWDIKKDLSGEIRSIASDTVRYEQYREYVRRQQFYRTYLHPVEATCNATHVITAEQADYLLDLAVKDGWVRREAESDLSMLALHHGWRVLRSGTDRAQDRKEIIDEYKKRLADSTTQARDSQRKLRLAERQLEAMKKEKEGLAKERDDAQRRVAEAQALAHNMSEEAQNRELLERKKAEDIQRKLDALTQRIEDGERERIEQAGPLLTMYMTSAELVAAQGIMKSFATLPPVWTDYARRIERDMADAKRLLDEAKRAMPRVERAEALVDEALAKCVDFEPARAFKASLLPAPPSGLTARRERGDVVLTWNPSPSQLVRYVVVRSVGSRPLSTRDGNRMATVGECAWRDTDALPARPLYYAVFTERNAMTSQLIVLETAVTILPDVSDVQAEASDATITLSWSLPGKAHAVRVIRSDAHVPQSIGDGQAFSLGQTSRFVDTGLINGRQYFYRVYCEYTGLDGQILHSEGVGAYAIPALPPSVVPALTMRGVDGITNHTVYLDFAEPEQGSLVIYRTTDAPPTVAETTLPITRYKEIFGFDCHEVISRRDMLLSPGAYTYTPVILFQQTAFVGKPQPYLYAPNVRSLKVVDDPANGIQLRWRWPSLKCDVVEVRSQPVASIEAIPSVVQANRTGSEDGICVLRNLLRGEYKVSVRACYQFKGQIVYSSEEAVHVIHVAPVRVRYRLERAHGFMSRRTFLVLTADQPVSLPDIRIVYGRGPLTAPGDGRTLCDFSPDSPRPASTWTVNLSDLPSEPDVRVRVFRKHETTETDIIFQSE